MALDYTILSKKKIMTKKSDFEGSTTVQALDLLSGSVNRYNEFMGVDILIVQKEYIARPDLISLAIYGDDKYADFICKANGLSNPFELNENMIIICPSIELIESMMDTVPEVNEFVNKKSDKITSGLYKSNKKNPTEKRSPVEATIYDHNYTYKEGVRGIVFY